MSAEGPDIREPRPGVASPEVGSENGSRWTRELQAWRLPSHRRTSRTRRLALSAAVLGFLAVVGYGAYLWHYSTLHVSTDDAFMSGHIAAVSPRISGTVVEVLANDNQDVKAGDLLVRLDPRDYEVVVVQARAAVEAARGDLQNAVVSVPLTDESTRSLLEEANASLAATGHARQITEHDLEQRRNDLSAKRSAVRAAQAAVQAAESDHDRAKLDLDRARQLFKQELTARQDLDHADASFRSAAAMLDVARQRLAQAQDDAEQAASAIRSQQATVAQAGERVVQSRATMANAQSQRQQVRVRQAQVEAARGRLALALANLQQAQLNAEYTDIRAPITGRVTKKAVEIGQVVSPGQPLLSVVDLDDLWVIANFKETELTRVRAGQSATVEVDTYPSKLFKARVDSIQGGSGAVFSLLPPENATGNYVKIVQRIPVKIVLAPGENAGHLLVPGMSVVPTITLR
jgi:membrane fusion protein (multidrug efflux system)